MVTDTKDDGGLAFPREARINPNGIVVHDGNSGMTLRQFYKAQAMVGILAGGSAPIDEKAAAAKAGLLADAMLWEDRAS